MPPTRAAAGALCSQQLVLLHFVIDFATVLTPDINSREMSPAFSCSAVCLGVWDSIPACSWAIVIAQVLQPVTGKEQHVGGFDLVWNDRPVSRGGELGALVNENIMANTHLVQNSSSAGGCPAWS